MHEDSEMTRQKSATATKRQRNTKATKKQKDKDIPPLPNYDLSNPDQEELVLENLAEAGARRTSQDLEQHKSTGPELTGGDLDADWQAAESVGDEAVGGHAPTPDQSVVDELGHAVGFDEKEGELHTLEERVARRDNNRWELDRRSADTEPTT
jgi:uncharacterized protein DUF6335